LPIVCSVASGILPVDIFGNAILVSRCKLRDW
jgi:hypothetical protein